MLLASTSKGPRISYAAGSIILRNNDNSKMSVVVYNMAGQRIMEKQTHLYDGYAEVRISNLPSGAYTARVVDSQGNQNTCKFIHK